MNVQSQAASASAAAPARSSSERLTFERRLPELDGIRGTAILLVLVAHYFARDLRVDPNTLVGRVNSVLDYGWAGVDLFFVLSGFLIGGILVDVKNSPNYFKTFYMRRFCRIFPIYYLSLLLFTGAVVLGAAQGGPALQWLFANPLPLWSYPLFLQNVAAAVVRDYGPYWTNITWSLAIEEQFYLILPLLVRFLSLKRLVQVVVASVLLAPILRVALWMSSPDGYIAAYVLMPCRADSLGLGVLAAILVRQPQAWAWLRNHTRWLYTALALLGAGVAALILRGYSIASLAMNSVGYSALALTFAVVLVTSVSATQGKLAAFFRSATLRLFGLYSYFLYVFHQAVLGLVQHFLLGREPGIDGWATAATTALALSAVVALAALSWKIYESPLIRRGHRFSYGGAA